MENIIKILIYGAIISFCASAWYHLFKGTKIERLLHQIGDDLDSSEQERLDKLLGSGKRYYNTSVILSLFLLSISTLEDFSGFELPLGSIKFPLHQTSIGIHLVVILLLIASERFFLMALPRLSLDKRRPPFDWVIMGLSFRTSYRIGAWFYIPLLTSSIGLGLILSENNIGESALSIPTIHLISMAVTYVPKTLYHWSHLISSRLDERGGRATLSIYLLYNYRVLRQILTTAYLAYPLLLIVPRWKLNPLKDVLEALVPYLSLIHI